MISNNRLARITMGALATGAFALTACSDGAGPTNNSARTPGTVSISLDNSSGTAIALAPRSATLMQGFGLLLQARIVD
ncbi:MAG TPA: hypothetical protein VE869_03140, partial [Gemmatimonas sp.]|nr:hypothetical protein [Gemmatimonas sp.]